MIERKELYQSFHNGVQAAQAKVNKLSDLLLEAEAERDAVAERVLLDILGLCKGDVINIVSHGRTRQEKCFDKAKVTGAYKDNAWLVVNTQNKNGSWSAKSTIIYDVTSLDFVIVERAKDDDKA